LGEALSHTQGKLTLKTAKIPPQPKPLSPAAILKICQQLHASTPVFAAYFNVNADTVRSWEKVDACPPVPICVSCKSLKKHPQIMVSA
jgi:DNA-binding transcriptional regulator YiaG